jgi:hypothetical protein
MAETLIGLGFSNDFNLPLQDGFDVNKKTGF